jgi:hypothetical protein
MVKNELEMSKLQPQKIKGIKNSKKTNHQTLQRLVPEHPKNSFHVALFFFEFRDDL